MPSCTTLCEVFPSKVTVNAATTMRPPARCCVQPAGAAEDAVRCGGLAEIKACIERSVRDNALHAAHRTVTTRSDLTREPTPVNSTEPPARQEMTAGGKGMGDAPESSEVGARVVTDQL